MVSCSPAAAAPGSTRSQVRTIQGQSAAKLSALGLVWSPAISLGAVGFGEGLVRGTAAPFKNVKTTRLVRRWQTETIADGRTIQVPEDILVDAYGLQVSLDGKK